MPFSRRACVVLVSLATLWLASAGAAQDAGAQADAGRVGVVLLPRGEGSSEMTDSLTELLIAAVAARGATEIVGKEEFQAALGRDDAGTLACIESDACLGRMGRELRVRELVAGTLASTPGDTPGDTLADTHTGSREHELHRDDETAERFHFDLYRLDVASGAVRGRVTREVDGGLPALLSALTSSVDELYVEHVEPGAIVVTASPREAEVSLDGEPLEPGADGALRRDFLAPGPHRLTARAAGREPISRLVPITAGTTLMLSLELAVREERLSIEAPTWALTGAAGALAIAGLALGVSSQAGPDRVLVMRESQAFYDARELEAVAANVLFGLAGAALVGAIVSLVLDLSSDGGQGEPVARGDGTVRW